ncbi:MAG TPA: type VI secretion system membrane subunit TssM [Pyrinomonadaceae bacterium]|nr:type VI secretion system membrane subunit TssM [Pyrinomonadaceae bacterium]
MSSITDQLKSLLGLSAIFSFYGVVSLATWFIGASLGINVSYVVVAIVLLLLTLPFALLLMFWRKRKAKAAAEAAASGAQLPGADGQPAPTQLSAPSGNYADLTNGAEETVQWLKNTRLGAAKSENALYALPWYLVAGPPASGKTSFVLSSGLNFHALPSQQGSDPQFIRPTRSCDWRVTDSAVLLDTTGRYQTESQARDEWSALIETIKKYRGARPLDGLLVPVSAEQLTRLKDPEIEQQAKLLRARIDEVIQRTKTRFPVYLVYTHIDAVDGFRDFFAAFGREERSQVWGATIPLNQSANAHALFDVEFDQLYDTLMRRRLTRLGAGIPPAQQIRIFNFPPRLGEARAKLGLFSSILFRPTPFSESPLLRGFYFTANVSGNRQAAGRGGAAAAPAGAAPIEPQSEARTIGEGFFTSRFFKEVLLSDQALAASFQAMKRRPNYLRNALLALAGLLMLFFAVGTIISFVKNKALVDEATERAGHVLAITTADNGKDPTKKDPAAARVEIEAANDLRESLAELDEYERDGPPLSLRFGLYSGDKIAADLRYTYFESIRQRFFQKTVDAIERDLKTFTASGGSNVPTTTTPGTNSASADAPSTEDALGKHYDLLKAYLMLGQPDKVEPTFLAATLEDYWVKFAPPDMEVQAKQQLEFYSRHAGPDDPLHYQANEQLVSQARRKLLAYPAANRFYKRITTEINAKSPFVNLDTILQGTGGGALTGTYTVPGSFTVEGYRKYVTPALASAAEEISKDDWVMGNVASAEAKNQGADVSKLQSMYFREYTDQWRKFLKGVSVKEYKKRDEAVDVLKTLSATDSPMLRVMETVAHNTKISAEPEGEGWIAWIKSFFGGQKEKDEAGGNTEIEKEFRPIFQFVPTESTKDSTPISQYRTALQSVEETLETTSDDQLTQTSKTLLTGKDDIGLQKAEQNIAKLLDGFKTAPAADAASLLKQPLGNLRAFLYGGGYAQIQKTWTDQIYPKARGIEAGFPFTDAGESSVADIAKFLNPSNGQLTQFFSASLASSFDDAQGQWKLKDSGAFKFSDEFVNYLNNARRLRDAMFPNGGAQPEVNYELALQPLTDADVIVDIDGQHLESRGTSSAKFTWPAKPGSPTGATIKVVPTGGATVAITDAQPLSFPGEWGLFKMINSGAPTRTPDGQIALTWTIGATQVRANLRPASANNPFTRTLFTALRAPQNPQK